MPDPNTLQHWLLDWSPADVATAATCLWLWVKQHAQKHEPRPDA